MSLCDGAVDAAADTAAGAVVGVLDDGAGGQGDALELAEGVDGVEGGLVGGGAGDEAAGVVPGPGHGAVVDGQQAVLGVVDGDGGGGGGGGEAVVVGVPGPGRLEDAVDALLDEAAVGVVGVGERLGRAVLLALEGEDAAELVAGEDRLAQQGRAVGRVAQLGELAEAVGGDGAGEGGDGCAGQDA